jgi:hypothetical protein
VLLVAAGMLVELEVSAGPRGRWRARRQAVVPPAAAVNAASTPERQDVAPPAIASPPALAVDPELMIADILRFRGKQIGETPEEQAEFAAALRKVAGAPEPMKAKVKNVGAKPDVDIVSALQRVIEHYEDSAAELESKFRILDAAEKRRQAELLREELRAISPRVTRLP